MALIRSTLPLSRRLASLTAYLLYAPASLALNNGAALTPPMGFATWNGFQCDYDDALLRQVADALVSNGLAAKGYEYVLVQECIVPAGARDPVTSVVIPNATKFPRGLADLAAYFHGRGLKAGIYTDVMSVTCAGYEGSGPGPGRASHWPLDALTYAQWGFDMIEADFCGQSGDGESAQQLYAHASAAIAAASAATNRTIAFYMCNWGDAAPWKWAPEFANLFRNTVDIQYIAGQCNFPFILRNFDLTVANSGTPPSRPGVPGTGIGAFNDPDSKLPTGGEHRRTLNPTFTPARTPRRSPTSARALSPLSPHSAVHRLQGYLGHRVTDPVLASSSRQEQPSQAHTDLNLTQFSPRPLPVRLATSAKPHSLWCILAAPLILGTDVRSASAYTLATIGNEEAIAIDQDPLGVQGMAFTPAVSPPAANVSYYYKPLLPQGGAQSIALAVLNRGDEALPGQNFSLADLGFAVTQRVAVRDIWAATTSAPVQGSFVTRPIDSHEALLLKLTPVT